MIKNSAYMRRLLRKRRLFVSATCQALANHIVQNGGSLEHRNGFFVARLSHQLEGIWVITDSIKIIILVKEGEDAWKGFLPLWDKEFEIVHAMNSLFTPLTGNTLVPCRLKEEELAKLLKRLRGNRLLPKSHR